MEEGGGGGRCRNPKRLQHQEEEILEAQEIPRELEKMWRIRASVVPMVKGELRAVTPNAGR